MSISLERFERIIEIDAATESPSVCAGDSCPVPGVESLQASMKRIGSEVWSFNNSLPESHLPLAEAAFATSVLALSLKSDNPPQFDSKADCAEGSSCEMSWISPASRSK